MKFYVAGLLVRPGPQPQVLLIRKNRPDWQAGRLNLIGGKVEPGEPSIYAMVREFREETGYPTGDLDWRLFCQLRHPSRDGHVNFYVATLDPDRSAPVACTDETIHWVDARWVHMHLDQCISNLSWLIPLALSRNEEYVDAFDNSLD